LRLLAAAGLCGLIGAEREMRERAAGLRTHMLVGVGAALFTIVSAYAWGDFLFDRSRGTAFDPTRIAAQIVTGIGFLGAGAILRQGFSIRGLTTAAGLWVAAAIGMAAGAGFWVAAVATTAIVMIGLGPFRAVEGVLNRFGGASGTLELDLPPDRAIGSVIELVCARRATIRGLELDAEPDFRRLRLQIELPLRASEPELVAELAARQDILAARWTD
jgi:putative Mg2+ transporter-C (MgtC) family protein